MNAKHTASKFVRSFFGSTPDFLVIGVQKSGTTSFYKYLCQHPQIFGCTLKEPGFFNYHFDRGWRWYRSNFPIRGPFKNKSLCIPANSHVFEATASYFFSPQAVERIKHHLPGCKFIVLLRNPTGRTLSHYRYKPTHPSSPEIFKETIEKEIEAIRGREEEIYDILVQHGSLKAAQSITDTFYVFKSLYSIPMRRWFDEFDRNQFLFLKAEDLFNTPQTVMNQAFDFLSIDRHTGQNYSIHNPSEKIPISRETIEKLDSYFEPFVDDFFSCTGVQLA